MSTTTSVPAAGHHHIPSIRISPPRGKVDDNLGLLANLAGTWEGEGFNLIARPDKEGGSPLFLELNETWETLSFIPISSSIPNRGFAVDDIELFGLTYQQKISDSVTKGALHIEPGIWVHIPSQDVFDPHGNLETASVARMGNVPHGNSLLAQGSAFEINPVVNPFTPSVISKVNTAPFKVTDPIPLPGTLSAFPPFDLTNLTPAAVNFRTPAGNVPATPLPATILGVAMQDVIKDPALLLDAVLANQIVEKMVVINIATVAEVKSEPLDAHGNPTEIKIPGGGGGVENLPFLKTNADAAKVFATFWLETIQGATPADDFLQLQYVQTVFLNFPILGVAPPVDLTWPHVSVATLRKTFGGQ